MTERKTPRVGRWTSETTWACPRPCPSPNHVDRASCDVCDVCHAVRPPLPETPAPTPEVSVLADICREHGDAEEQRLYGKEPMAGVDDAPQELVEALSDYVMATKSSGAFSDAEFFDREMRVQRIVAALRAAPAVGGEPVAYVHRSSYGEVWTSRTTESAEDATSAREALDRLYPDCAPFVVVPLYAHPAPDGDTPRIPAALMRQYEHAAEKAESVGALKMLHKAEAAIGRWCLKALATPTPSEDRPDAR